MVGKGVAGSGVVKDRAAGDVRFHQEQQASVASAANVRVLADLPAAPGARGIRPGGKGVRGQIDLPQGRHGKHKTIVTQLLSDLDQLGPGQALKIPLTELSDRKENIRSALNRATRIKGLDVATSSDNDHFYVWVPEHKST